MTLKHKLYQECQLFINHRFQAIQNSITDIQNGLESETKSSAGDKHETGRAMLQLEREKAGHQLAEIEKQQEILQKINLNRTLQNVAFGSLVSTTQFNYFIAISAGKIIVENKNYYAISVSTPIAQLLLSKQTGDRIKFRDSRFTIIEIH